MKRYLVRLTYISGVSKGLSSYLPVTARTAQSATNKARKYIERNYSHSMHVPCVDGVQTVETGTEQELKADIANFQQIIEETELSLNRAKNTLYDLKRQFNALRKFEEEESC